MVRNRTLAEVYADIEADTFWEELRVPGINFVPGYGSTTPRVMLVGEAPGATENARKRPFCGPSGRVLDQLLDLAGIWTYDSLLDPSRPANAFITNVVKYRPPGNRTPSAAEIHHGLKALREEWQALGEPRVLIAIGGTAHTAISPAVTSVSRNLGTWHQRGEIWIRSVLHPAYALHKRDKRIQEDMEKDWEEIGNFLSDEGLL